jgi:uncharacterized membrane protein
MDAAIFSTEGFLFVLRWLHVFFGVIWIGHLYYFNFVQGLYFAEIEPAQRATAQVKLLPKALWWFRWGAFWTMTTGLIIVGYRYHQFGTAYFEASRGFIILVGSLLGLTMGLNVWFVIWPNQKVVIASATQVLGGGQALPNAAACGAKALLASRTNTMFSIPMLFFMTGAVHLPVAVSPDSKFIILWPLILLIVGLLEFNALKGKLGWLTTIKGVVTCGFALTAVLYVLIEILK